jgi:PTS system galactitol-specific IIA component
MESSNNELKSLILPDFVEVGLEAADKESAIRSLAALLFDKKYVKDTYIDAVLTREKSFPTGLRTLDVHVAIPHCDVGHCNNPGIAVGVLSSPVEFLEMATLDQFVDTKIIFLLAITEPEQQVVWLARLVNLFQTPGFLIKLSEAENSEIGYQILTEAFRKEVELGN